MPAKNVKMLLKHVSKYSVEATAAEEAVDASLTVCLINRKSNHCKSWTSLAFKMEWKRLLQQSLAPPSIFLFKRYSDRAYLFNYIYNIGVYILYR